MEARAISKELCSYGMSIPTWMLVFVKHWHQERASWAWQEGRAPLPFLPPRRTLSSPDYPKIAWHFSFLLVLDFLLFALRCSSSNLPVSSTTLPLSDRSHRLVGAHTGPEA